jgi:hypothetical protein
MKNSVTKLDSTISEACSMIRKSWVDPERRRVDPDSMIGSAIIAHDAESLDRIGEHLRLMVEYRNSAQQCIKLFKSQLALCREKIAEAKIAINWIADRDVDGPTIRMVSEAINKDEEDVISRLLRMLDKQTYYYLVGLKGSKCPLCDAEKA